MSFFIIDYENVNSPANFYGIHYLLPQDTLTMFYSSHCPLIRHDIVQRIIRSGCNFNAIKLKKDGKNALDMYIASYIAEIISEYNGEKQIAILSRDKGYAAIKDYWALKDSSSHIIQTNTIFEAFNSLSGTVDLDRQLFIKKLKIKNINKKIAKFKNTLSHRITFEKAYDIYINSAHLAAAV